MSYPILKTKLHIPSLAQDFTPREHLITTLNDGLIPGIPLIVLSAPAGYGKTSLVSAWISQLKKENYYVTWINLEPADNDPIRFFNYLVSGLEPYLPDLKPWMEDLLDSPTLPKIEEILTILINQLTLLERPVIIVLDDFHVIKQPELHTALEFFVEHSPDHVHIVISSRSDPPIKLHRLRARAKIVELRLMDLRFSFDEINQLTKASQPNLNKRNIQLLEEKTEGWIAGIRMVLLSLQGREDPGELLKKLSGEQRFIMEFLSEEAFHNQNKDTQEFLLITTVVDRFCAPLCDEIRESNNSREILDDLEKTNSFLIALGEDRHWYRYHHLFRDLLKIKILQVYKDNKAFIQTIHHKAADWFYRNQFAEEAIHLYIQADDHKKAAELVETSTTALFSAGKLHQLLSWIQLLPQELRFQRPRLNIYEAWSLAFAGKIPEALSRLERAEPMLIDQNLPESDRQQLQADIQAIRSLIAISSGNIAEAMQLIKVPQVSINFQSKFARSVQEWSIGYALRIKGDLDGAENQFRDALDIAYDLQNVYSIVSTAVDLGEILRQKGELTQAEEIFRSAYSRTSRTSVIPGFVGRLEAFLANLLLEKREMDEAITLLNQAYIHNQEWQNPNHGAYACLVMAKYYYALKNYSAASQAMQEIAAWINKGPIVSTLRNSIDLIRINIWLAEGDLARARLWLAENKPVCDLSADQINESSEVSLLAIAKIYLADGMIKEAIQIISTLEENARNKKRISMLIQLLVLNAVIETNRVRAKEALQEGLQLGLSKGYRQVFIEYGQKLLPLLEELHDLNGVSELLSVIYQNQSHPEGEENVLTEREMEIIKWMSTGLTNAEIGERLFIAPGTVKAHTASIYRKLDVSNRTEAIAKAKDMNLI